MSYDSPGANGGFDASVAATVKGIPDYNALKDKHCTYTKSRAFAQSPYAQVAMIHAPPPRASRKRQRADDPTLRYYRQQQHGKNVLHHHQVWARRDSSTSELAAYKAIFTRENCLCAFRKQVRKFCDWFNSKNPTGAQGHEGALAVWSVTETKLYDTLDQLRSLTLDAVEAVDNWRKQVVKAYPGMKPAQVEFMWKGSNYLVKVIHDLDFVADMTVNIPKYVVPLRFFRDSIRFPLTRNPLVTPLALDEMVQDLQLKDIRQMEKFAKAIGHAWARIFAVAELIRQEEIAVRTSAKFSASIAQDGAASAAATLATSPAMQKLQVNIPSPREAAFHVGVIDESDSDKDDDDDDCDQEMAGDIISIGVTAGSIGSKRHTSKGTAPRPANEDTGCFFSVEIDDIVALQIMDKCPHMLVCAVLGAIKVLLLPVGEPMPTEHEMSWKSLKVSMLNKPVNLLEELLEFDPSTQISTEKAYHLQLLFSDDRFTPEEIRRWNVPAARLCSWALLKAGRRVLRPESCFDYGNPVLETSESSRSGMSTASNAAHFFGHAQTQEGGRPELPALRFDDMASVSEIQSLRCELQELKQKIEQAWIQSPTHAQQNVQMTRMSNIQGISNSLSIVSAPSTHAIAQPFVYKLGRTVWEDLVALEDGTEVKASVIQPFLHCMIPQARPLDAIVVLPDRIPLLVHAPFVSRLSGGADMDMLCATSQSLNQNKEDSGQKDQFAIFVTKAACLPVVNSHLTSELDILNSPELWTKDNVRVSVWADMWAAEQALNATTFANDAVAETNFKTCQVCVCRVDKPRGLRVKVQWKDEASALSDATCGVEQQSRDLILTDDEISLLFLGIKGRTEGLNDWHYSPMLAEELAKRVFLFADLDGGQIRAHCSRFVAMEERTNDECNVVLYVAPPSHNSEDDESDVAHMLISAAPKDDMDVHVRELARASLGTTSSSPSTVTRLTLTEASAICASTTSSSSSSDMADLTTKTNVGALITHTEIEENEQEGSVAEDDIATIHETKDNEEADEALKEVNSKIDTRQTELTQAQPESVGEKAVNVTATYPHTGSEKMEEADTAQVEPEATPIPIDKHALLPRISVDKAGRLSINRSLCTTERLMPDGSSISIVAEVRGDDVVLMSSPSAIMSVSPSDILSTGQEGESRVAVVQRRETQQIVKRSTMRAFVEMNRDQLDNDNPSTIETLMKPECRAELCELLAKLLPVDVSSGLFDTTASDNAGAKEAFDTGQVANYKVFFGPSGVESLLGSIDLSLDATLAEARQTVMGDFDAEDLPPVSFRFLWNNDTMCSIKQETKRLVSGCGGGMISLVPHQHFANDHSSRLKQEADGELVYAEGGDDSDTNPYDEFESPLVMTQRSGRTDDLESRASGGTTARQSVSSSQGTGGRGLKSRKTGKSLFPKRRQTRRTAVMTGSDGSDQTVSKAPHTPGDDRPQSKRSIIRGKSRRTTRKTSSLSKRRLKKSVSKGSSRDDSTSVGTVATDIGSLADVAEQPSPGEEEKEQLEPIDGVEGDGSSEQQEGDPLIEPAEAVAVEQEVLVNELKKTFALPGTVTLTPDSKTCITSLSLNDKIEPGMSIEINGERFTVSEDPENLLEGTTLTLVETPRMIHEVTPNLRAAIVVLVPATPIPIDGTVALDEYKRTISTTTDMRDTLRPGTTVRFASQRTNLYTVSSSKLDDFSAKRITLSKAYTGPTVASTAVEWLRDDSAETKAKQLDAAALRKRNEKEAGKKEKFFGMTMTWAQAAADLEFDHHMRVDDFFSQVSSEFAVKASFTFMCTSSFPASEGLDAGKFSKLFVRELPGVINKKFRNTDVDLMFSKSKSKDGRKMNFATFRDKALPLVAAARYPTLGPPENVKEFVRNHIVPWKECTSLVWSEARRLAIVEEIRRQCAATCLAAIIRQWQCRTAFLSQTRSASRIQRAFQKYLIKCHVRREYQQERLEFEKKRAAVRTNRQARKRAKLFAQARQVQGRFMIVSVYRMPKAAINVVVFDTLSCTNTNFVLEKSEATEIIESALGTTLEQAKAEGSQGSAGKSKSASAGGDDDDALYSRQSVEALAAQLTLRKRGGENVLVFCRKSAAPHGKLLLTRGLFIPRNDLVRVLHVVKVVQESGGSFAFAAYNPDTSVTKNVKLTRERLLEWLGYSPTDATLPYLLQIQNLDELLHWFLQRLFLCSACGMHTHLQRHRHGESILMLEYEVVIQRENTMAMRIQAMWRSRKALKYIRSLVRNRVIKRFDKNYQLFYYYNAGTGEMSWEKPKLMGSEDIEDPVDAWEQLVGEDGQPYYFHALTGRMTWMSVDQAATVVQRKYRSQKAAEFRITDLSFAARAFRIHDNAEANYISAPLRLSSIINYALHLFTMKHDMTKAKTLFEKAYELAPKNPVVLFSFSMFTLVNNAYPRHSTFELAMKYAKTARLLNPTADMFDVALKSFFHWAMVRDPRNTHRMLNWAVAHQMITRNYEKAERFYRIAIDLDPTNESAINNYADFREQRLPGGQFGGGGPGGVVLRRSKPVRVVAAWRLMEDPEASHAKFARFWHNMINDVTQWEEPIWDFEAVKRRERANVVGTDATGEWQVLADSFDQSIFYYCFKTGETTDIRPQDWRVAETSGENVH